MTNRRDLLIGAACLAGAGAAAALVPHKRVILLPRGRHIDSVVPRAFGGSTSQDVSDLVAPKEEDSLASRLYEQTVGRVYTLDGGGPEIMMLLAYGDTQTDDLQLHRPEICYPAFGFSISQSAIAAVPLPGGVSLPCRRLVADAPDRREIIVYWSRLGEYLPLDRKQQQLDRLQTAMRGEIADGLLARFSLVGGDPDAGVSAIEAFISAIVRAVAADSRSVLIGARRAMAMSAAGV